MVYLELQFVHTVGSAILPRSISTVVVEWQIVHSKKARERHDQNNHNVLYKHVHSINEKSYIITVQLLTKTKCINEK